MSAVKLRAYTDSGFMGSEKEPLPGPRGSGRCVAVVRMARIGGETPVNACVAAFWRGRYRVGMTSVLRRCAGGAGAGL